jgi:hypothetical protein
MKTSSKSITNLQNWRLAAIALGSALAMPLATTAFAAGPPNINSGNATGTVNVAFFYQITANQTIPNGNWGATGLPPGSPVFSVSATGLITGTPNTAGTYSVVLSAKNASNQTGTKTVTFTINSGPTALATISSLAVYTGDIVTLDASASHTNPDPDGGTLTYLWQQIAPGSPPISLAPNNKAVMATFAAPAPPVGQDSQAVTFDVKVTDDSVSGGAKNTTSDPVTTTVYRLPVANAGQDQSKDQGTLVMLNGSGSTGMNLTYAWTAPPGIKFTDTGTQTTNAVNPTFTAPPFTPPSGMSYTFTLQVTEQRPNLAPKQSLPDTVVIMVKQPPIALTNLSNDINTASRNSQGNVGESSCSYTTPVTLYGFGVDPDLDTFTYTWTQVHDTGGTPIGAGDTIVNLNVSPSSPQAPTFTAPDVPNGQQQIDLVFQLIVNDGTINSAPAYVTVHVLNTNDPPIAALTVNGQTPDMNNAVDGVHAGTQVTLDGSTSSDPNPGTSFTYTWTQIDPDLKYPVTGFSANPASPLATFTAPAVDAKQGSITLTFQLTVSDGDCTDTKQVSIMVVNNNRPPIADAGQTQNVPEGSPVSLDGFTGSYDPDTDPITFLWTHVHDTTGAPLQGTDPVVTFDSSSPTPSFVAPTFGGSGGSLTFQLIVTDSHGTASDPSYVVINVNPNSAPVPHAGPDHTVNEHTTVALIGSATDADNNPLTYTWDQVHDTSGSPPAPTDLQATVTYQNPSDPSNPNASFVAPEVPCEGGTVVMRLTVNDGYVDAFAYVTITINNVNNNPNAVAGSPQNVNEAATVLLNGSNSSDMDPGETQTLTFLWTAPSGITFTDTGTQTTKAASPTFTAPNIGGGDPSKSVDLSFHLVVSDGCGGSGASDTTVHVANIPHSPTAMATAPATASEGGNTVTLDGSGSSDPDDDPLTYTWTAPAGITFSDTGTSTSNAQKPTFKTPWVSTNTPLTFQLTVNDPYVGIDGDVASVANVTVTVLNINTPPILVNPTADPAVLWPPDHRLVSVHILGVIDPDQPPYNSTITINSITQDEPTNGLGDGDTPVDAIITHNPGSDDTLLLRAERSGKGDGRVYHVCFTAADPEGSVSGCVDVVVPHDKRTDPSKDSGQKYNSTK